MKILKLIQQYLVAAILHSLKEIFINTIKLLLYSTHTNFILGNMEVQTTTVEMGFTATRLSMLVEDSLLKFSSLALLKSKTQVSISR